MYLVIYKNFIDTHRFVYINVSKIPGLLNDGEWEWYIKNAGFHECTCAIKAEALKNERIIYKDSYKI